MRRLALPILVTVLGGGLLGLLIYGITHQAASRTLDDSLASGHPPLAPEPDHSLLSLSGVVGADLDTYRGDVVLLNFWASWCVPCEEEAPLLEHAQSTLLRHRATVLGVTFRDVTTDSRAFVARFHLTYPMLRDISGTFAHSYGTDQLPESFLINRQGRIVSIRRGEVNKAFVQNALALAQGS
jgi:cytochrome c biogenesis protein CcmG, thiol:disulfide interchange protein DsbE